MANRSRWLAKTLTIGAEENSGRLACAPLRSRAMVCSSAVAGAMARGSVRGVARRELHQFYAKELRSGTHVVERKLRRHALADHLTFGVVGVGSEAEANGAGIGFFRGREVLSQAREFSQQKRQDACGHGIECAEVADRFFAGDFTKAVYHIVTGDTAWFIDYEQPVHSTNLAVLSCTRRAATSHEVR